MSFAISTALCIQTFPLFLKQRIVICKSIDNVYKALSNSGRQAWGYVYFKTLHSCWCQIFCLNSQFADKVKKKKQQKIDDRL